MCSPARTLALSARTAESIEFSLGNEFVTILRCQPGTKPLFGGTVNLTRDGKRTVVERVERDPTLAKALLKEAAALFLTGEPDTARLILRDLVNATIGFEALAELTHKPSKSLHRMLSQRGNPSMDNLAAIFGAIQAALKANFGVRVVKAV